MKVLLANSSFGGGGITTYAHELVKCLSQDYELIVVLGDDSLRPITIPGVTVLHYDTEDISKENALFFIKLVNEEVRPDLIISSFGLIIPIIAPYLNDNIRVLTVSHSGKFLSSEYSAINHKYIDNIIAASSGFNKEYLERRFHIKDKSKVKVIYNFKAADSELESFRLTKKDNNPISIVYAGGWFPVKNPDLVLKVLRGLLDTNLQFKFYWTGGTWIPLVYKKAFRWIKLKDIRQLVQKDDRVVFTGKIKSKLEFDELIASSNILISPSHNEGCSMLLLEALRSGSICVVADYPNSNREIVEKGNCGFVVNHKKPKDFVQIISEIISNPEKYTCYYENAYNTYQNILSYPVWKSGLDELFAERINHHPRKDNISMLRVSYDIFRLKTMIKLNPIRRFKYTIKSLGSYFAQYIKMRIRGEFSTSNSMMNNNY